MNQFALSVMHKCKVSLNQSSAELQLLYQNKQSTKSYIDTNFKIKNYYLFVGHPLHSKSKKSDFNQNNPMFLIFKKS